MRLVIDDERAASSSVGTRFGRPHERDGAVVLDVPLEPQLLDNWCWASIASGLGRFYAAADASQAEVASAVLDEHIEEGDHGPGVDTTARLDQALRFVGVYSHWSAGKPLFDRVRYEINLGRPFAARVGWHAGPGHYVVVHGYRDEGRQVLVADPLHGAGEYPIDEFPRKYQRGGAWTETLWTGVDWRGDAGSTIERRNERDDQ